MKKRFSIFSLGLTTFLLSNLFYGREMEITLALHTTGFILAMIALLTMIFGQGGKKTTIIAVGMGFLVYFSQPIVNPLLKKHSLNIYLKQHEESLLETCNVLEIQTGDFQLLNDSVNINETKLKNNEIEKIILHQKTLKTYLISKSSGEIHFGLWGFLDNRSGLIYTLSGKAPQINRNCTHLKDGWYFY